VVLTPEERAEAMGLLRDPKLLDRVLEDFRRLGVVGEETNKLIGYLATVSRKLDAPLAVIVQSSSAAGKSSLMEAVLALVPEEERGDNPYRTRYLDDRYLEQPALAIGQATREALRMGDVAQAMLRDAMVVLRTDNQELLEDVERRDDQLDYLEREIKIFLSRLGHETMSPDLAQKEIALISFIGNLENIGDIIDKNLMELARKKLYQGRRFSEAGEAELIEFHSMVSKNLERAIAGFAANDRSLAQEVLDQRPVVRQRERELRDSHLARLRRGLAESLETSEIHLDVLTNLKRISSHITALVYPILEEEA
jgi:phosphate:Na+ symporter